MYYFGIYIASILLKCYTNLIYCTSPYGYKNTNPVVVSYFTTAFSRSVRLFKIRISVTLDNFIFRKLFKYFNFHLDRENFKITLKGNAFHFIVFTIYDIVTT
jgi:hypothetical protein